MPNVYQLSDAGSLPFFATWHCEGAHQRLPLVDLSLHLVAGAAVPGLSRLLDWSAHAIPPSASASFFFDRLPKASAFNVTLLIRFLQGRLPGSRKQALAGGGKAGFA